MSKSKKVIEGKKINILTNDNKDANPNDVVSPMTACQLI